MDQRKAVDALGEFLRHHDAAVVGEAAVFREIQIHHGQIFRELQQPAGMDIAALLLEGEGAQMGKAVMGQRVLHLAVVHARAPEELLGHIGAAGARDADDEEEAIALDGLDGVGPAGEHFLEIAIGLQHPLAALGLAEDEGDLVRQILEPALVRGQALLILGMPAAGVELAPGQIGMQELHEGRRGRQIGILQRQRHAHRRGTPDLDCFRKPLGASADGPTRCWRPVVPYAVARRSATAGHRRCRGRRSCPCMCPPDGPNRSGPRCRPGS